MSRNKVILLIAVLVMVYMVLPNDGVYGIIKMNMIAIAPYIMIGIIVYLLITINLLKRRLYQLSNEISEENTVRVTRLLRMSFDVKRMVGTVNLVNVYKRVNTSRYVSIAAKNDMYEVLRRKRIDVPLPSGGKKNK